MLEKHFKKYAEIFAIPFVNICLFLKVKPNQLSFFGLLLVIIGALSVFYEYTISGIILLFIGSALDGLDGPLARKLNNTSKHGAFIDSTVDRVGEMFIWSIFAIKFTRNDIEVFIVFTILTASFLIPYARAKAESMNIYNKTGITPRPERVLFAIFYMSIFPGSIYLYIFSLLVWFTVYQRISIIYREI